MSAAIRIRLPALVAVAFAAALGGCLLQQPLVRPDDAYDARAALRRDSLERFDSVEVWLEDAEDSTVLAMIWKGPLASAESLGVGVADGERKMVYVVHGFKRDRGLCFVERKSREGATTDLKDTCQGKDTVDPDKKPPPPAYVRPRFASRVLDLVDTVSATIGIDDLVKVPGSATSREGWLSILWKTSGDKDSGETNILPMLRVSARSWNLPVGRDSGYIVLDSAGFPLDSLLVRLTVSDRFARGKAVDWEAGAAQAGFRVELTPLPIGSGKGYSGLTEKDGSFDIAVKEALPAAYISRLSAPGRIGRLDTLRLLPGQDSSFALTLPRAGSFRSIDLDNELETRSVAVAAGYGIVLSTPFGHNGYAHLVRMGARPPVFEKSLPLENNDGDADHPEYYESGEMIADSDALYIAYSDANRIGRIGSWRTSPIAKTVSVPIQPGGLLRDGDCLLTLGRLSDGTLALARFLAADLTLQEIDTLPGYAWDGMLPTQFSPKLVSGSGGYYAVDRSGPNMRAHVLLIDRENGKVRSARDLSEGEADGLAWVGGMLYVGGFSQGSHWIRGYRADLSPADSIDAGAPVDRLAADGTGRFGGYAFATSAENDSVFVFAPFSREPLGRIPVPGAGRARSIALDPASRTVLVSDGHTLNSASF